jgi:MFS family permease
MEPDATRLSPLRSDLLSVLLSLGFFVTAILQGSIPVMGTVLRSELGLSSARVGLLMSAFLVAYALAQTPAGVLATRSARDVIALGFLAMIAGSLLFAFSSTYEWFFVARLIQGLGAGAMLPSAGVVLVRYLPPQRLGRGWAIYGGAGSVGYLVLLLGLARVVEWGGVRPFFLIAAFLALAGAAATLAISALVRHTRVEFQTPQLKRVGSDLLLLARSRVIILLGLVNVAGIAVSVGVLTWTPAYLQDDFGATLGVASALTAGFAAAQTLAAPLSAALLARFGHLPLLVAVFTGATAAVATLPFLSGVTQTFFVVLVVGLCTALAFAPSFAVIPMLVEIRLVGMAGGYLNAFGFMGALFAPWIFGIFLDEGLSYGAGYLMLAGFGLGGSIAALGLAVTLTRSPARVGAVH